MRVALLLMALAGASLVVPSATATKQPGPLALVVRGLERATASGALDPDEATSYRSIAARAVAEAPKLPTLRAATLRGNLADVAAQWRSYTKPWALTLFSMLAVNEHELATRALPASGTDVEDADGVVYRFFPGHGYVFHPLGNVARLNLLVSRGDADGAGRLAAALLARAVPSGQGLVWQYPFAYGRGRPPWTSGMAQAVAAQALARAGDLLSDPTLLDAADEAYAAILGGLVRQLPQGPWIELYSFDRAAVLNAQLQTVLSLGDYAEITGDAGAAALAARLQATAEKLLPRFDTGYWSLYALDGPSSSLSYHDYVIDLLRRLTARTGDPTWKTMADRFAQYELEPPVLKLGGSSRTIYPEPEDGYLDVAPLRFWLSKPARVTLRVGSHAEALSLDGGWHTLEWAPGDVPSGLYRPRLVAVDDNGHRVEGSFDPIHVETDEAPPQLSVTVAAPATVSWRAVDPGTPWLDVVVRLTGGGERTLLRLGRRGLAGTVRLALPPGRWHATLVATNSAGKSAQRSLGYVPR